MFKCETLIISSGNVNANGLEIGGMKLKIKEDGSLSTTDNKGKENIITNKGFAYGKIKHLEIGINDTIQTIQNNEETLIYFDEGFSISDDDDFSIGDNENSIKILTSGHYFISFNISLDMYKGNRTTVGGYLKSNINDKIEKSVSYSYFHGTSYGFGSINNSFILNASENEEITLYVLTKEGNGKFYTVPESTNFNIFRIE